jgi:hypothetical protein
MIRRYTPYSQSMATNMTKKCSHEGKLVTSGVGTVRLIWRSIERLEVRSSDKCNSSGLALEDPHDYSVGDSQCSTAYSLNSPDSSTCRSDVGASHISWTSWHAMVGFSLHTISRELGSSSPIL